MNTTILVTLENGEEITVGLDVPQNILNGEPEGITAYINNWIDGVIPFAKEWKM